MVVKDIETKEWNTIIESLKKRGWIVKSEYDNFDAGIDFSAYTLRKGNQKIYFEWDNWSEGEIRGSKEILELIEDLGFDLKNKEKRKNALRRLITSIKRILNI